MATEYRKTVHSVTALPLSGVDLRPVTAGGKKATAAFLVGSAPGHEPVAIVATLEAIAGVVGQLLQQGVLKLNLPKQPSLPQEQRVVVELRHAPLAIEATVKQGQPVIENHVHVPAPGPVEITKAIERDRDGQIAKVVETTKPLGTV